MLRGNTVIGQSGGPTCAINATLSGVVRGIKECDCIDKCYGMLHGIDGFLQEELVDLLAQLPDEYSHRLL